MKRMMTRVAAGVVAAAGWACAAPSPTSYGEAAKVDTPILRVPFAQKAPVIDGVMEEGEWEDASALSGFWYDYANSHFFFLAPHQTQLQLYAAYDKENLYVAYVSPIYPENSWLKARGRFPDVYGHPLYGLIWDDHIELELRPVSDNVKGFNLGLFKFFVNPINTTSDQYWSKKGGEGKEWQSGAKIRSGVDGKRWILEIAVPLKSMAYGAYAANGPDGRPLVTLPPPDGTAYRGWFTRGIGGNGDFYNAFDNHIWNTTKTMLIFDSQAPAFQINDMGPIMEDTVDFQFTVKNHNTRSETVRVGFFVESEEGLIYSSYEAPDMKDGLLELRPGEVRKLRLRKAFPGISTDGNVLWFDVRSAGKPAKSLFLTRLIKFHSMEGGVVRRGEHSVSFVDRRLNVFHLLRPPRQDFDFRFELSTYHKRISAVVDLGVNGASEEAKTAKEAKLELRKADGDEAVIAEARSAFAGNFATFLMDAPKLVDGESYNWSVLLFDENKKIVGERKNEMPVVFEVPVWQNNTLGLNDVVWEPFTAIQKTEQGFETLNHRFTVDASALPAQIFIKADPRELPLEARRPGTPEPAAAALQRIGRGPQLKEPFRLEVVTADGTRTRATVVEPAKVVRQWQSEIVYAAKLRAGDIRIGLQAQYDCDGAMHVTLSYGAAKPVTVKRFEMLMSVAGTTDMAVSAVHGGGMAASDRWECALPDKPGVVWDVADLNRAELYYSRLVPWLWFGSADRGFSWYADSDRAWRLDKDGSTMTLERDAAGDVAMRVAFVNHESAIGPEKELAFTILTHPSKPKPADSRFLAWYHKGLWADEFPGGELYMTDAELTAKAKTMEQRLGKQPKEARVPGAPPPIAMPQQPQQQAQGKAPQGAAAAGAVTWNRAEPPFWRVYQLRNIGSPKEAGTPDLNQLFEDKFTYYFDRHIRIGRRQGWWWDESWPAYRSHNVAEGDAYFRDPATVEGDELPWQDGHVTGHMRNMFKRLARVFKQNGMPQRNYLWANNSATAFESFAWDTMLVEECGSEHRTFEVDALTVFPNSLYRYMSHRFTGLIPRLVPGVIMAQTGDDQRLDRLHIGRALLNDIGLNYSGPHGHIVHREQPLRVLELLHRFGFFDDPAVEVLPFWRADTPVVYGEGTNQVNVTAYRRPGENGKGVKVLLILLNESDADQQMALNIRDTARVLGGANTLRVRQIREQMPVGEGLKSWWQARLENGGDGLALMDLESGEAIRATDAAGAVYGPIHVPWHDYRLLYAERAE